MKRFSFSLTMVLVAFLMNFAQVPAYSQVVEEETVISTSTDNELPPSPPLHRMEGFPPPHGMEGFPPPPFMGMPRHQVIRRFLSPGMGKKRHPDSGISPLLNVIRILDRLEISDEQFLRIRRVVSVRNKELREARKELTKSWVEVIKNFKKGGKLSDQDVKNISGAYLEQQKRIITARLSIFKVFGDVLNDKQKARMMQEKDQPSLPSMGRARPGKSGKAPWFPQEGKSPDRHR